MRTRIGFIQKRHALAIGQGTDVTLTWTETVGGTPDPVNGTIVGGVTTARTAVVKALDYTVSARSGVRQFVEIKEGDKIMDFLPDVDLDNKPGLRFEIEGELYETAKISEQLAKCWDVTFRGIKTSRTVLLTQAT